MVTREQVGELEWRACQLRHLVVSMMGSGKAHHFGGSLSVADIVVSLYFYKMRYECRDPCWPDRDRFIMSKGHAVPAQYAALALKGVIPIEELATLKRLGSRLQGHPAMHLTPGIEGCTGSLGQGLSYANGLALAGRIAGRAYRTFCVLGDGELHEGQIWEAAMTARRRKLSKLTVIIDRNGLKGMDNAESGKSLEPLKERWQAFGWAVRAIDGHDMNQLCNALDWAVDEVRDVPAAIIARTVKGRGVSFIENAPDFHNAAMTEKQLGMALEELESHLEDKRDGG